jgi:hypothetical protein
MVSCTKQTKKDRGSISSGELLLCRNCLTNGVMSSIFFYFFFVKGFGESPCTPWIHNW